MELPTYASLLTLEPRLAELEARVRAVTDDGAALWFCSNFVWLPLNADLKDLIGAARRARGADPWLHSSHAYEVAYEHLSRLMPPCRACGCRAFQPYQEAQAVDAERREASATTPAR